MKSTNPEQNNVRLPEAGKNMAQLALYKVGERKLNPRWIARHNVSPQEVRSAGARRLIARVAVSAVLAPAAVFGLLAASDNATEHSSVKNYDQQLIQNTNNQHHSTPNLAVSKGPISAVPPEPLTSESAVPTFTVPGETPEAP